MLSKLILGKNKHSFAILSAAQLLWSSFFFLIQPYSPWPCYVLCYLPGELVETFLNILSGNQVRLTVLLALISRL